MKQDATKIWSKLGIYVHQIDLKLKKLEGFFSRNLKNKQLINSNN